MSITRAKEDVEVILRREDSLSEAVIEIAEQLLITRYDIYNPLIRMQIIQNAAIEVGLLRAEDID